MNNFICIWAFRKEVSDINKGVGWGARDWRLIGSMVREACLWKWKWQGNQPAAARWKCQVTGKTQGGKWKENTGLLTRLICGWYYTCELWGKNRIWGANFFAYIISNLNKKSIKFITYAWLIQSHLFAPFPFTLFTNK